MTGQSGTPSITPPPAAGAAEGPWRPQRLALVRGGRLLKRWRYVAFFSEQLMACAAQVQIGPARQCFWALYRRDRGQTRERTHLLRGRAAVALAAGSLRLRDAGVQLQLSLQEGGAVCARCDNGGGIVWTRKQAGVPAAGTLALDGRSPRPLRGLAVIDDTAGYHPRHTEWFWSAGAGSGEDGAPLAWNLVSGINDPPSGSERAVWVAGRARECAPVSFDADLREISAQGGALLRFYPQAQRSRADNLLIVRSDYRASLGSFSGTLPGAPGAATIELAYGLGVMEHHRALW